MKASMNLKEFGEDYLERLKRRKIAKKEKDKKTETRASGGRVGFDKGGRADIITSLLDTGEYTLEEAIEKANDLLPDEVETSDLSTAVSGLETSFGRGFGNVEPVPMLRFAEGGGYKGIESDIVNACTYW